MQIDKNLITMCLMIFEPEVYVLKKIYLVTGMLIALILFMLWLINMDIIMFGKTAESKTSQLEKVGNDCVNIAENAVAHMVAVVEFQKLEIIGRKARVMRMCMQDHGYQQNPAWTTYAMPIAEKIAKESQVSFDEAFENLRRRDMVIFKAHDNQPLFWLAKTQK